MNLHNNELLEQFNNMKKMPIIEINWADYLELEDDEWEIFYIQANNNGLYCNDMKIEWDNSFSLDEHLALLYEKIIENKLND